MHVAARPSNSAAFYAQNQRAESAAEFAGEDYLRCRTPVIRKLPKLPENKKL